MVDLCMVDLEEEVEGGRTMADDAYSPEQKQQLLSLQDQIKSWQAILSPGSHSTPEQQQEALNDIKAVKKTYGDISKAKKGYKLYQSLSKASDAAETTSDASDAGEVMEGLAETGEVLEDLAPLLLL